MLDAHFVGKDQHQSTQLPEATNK